MSVVAHVFSNAGLDCWQGKSRAGRRRKYEYRPARGHWYGTRSCRRPACACACAEAALVMEDGYYQTAEMHRTGRVRASDARVTECINYGQAGGGSAGFWLGGQCPLARAALSIWWALRTSLCRGPNPSVDRRVRWMRRGPYARAYRAYRLMRPCLLPPEAKKILKI